MPDEEWARARLVSVEPRANGRIKIIVEFDADPHQLAGVAAQMLRQAADEASRPPTSRSPVDVQSPRSDAKTD